MREVKIAHSLSFEAWSGAGRLRWRQQDRRPKAAAAEEEVIGLTLSTEVWFGAGNPWQRRQQRQQKQQQQQHQLPRIGRIFRWPKTEEAARRHRVAGESE
mmetsp:Transcript_24800/g.70587  ORF Transcript_24800/g.70587 Transcript_24800/m.70587 type:complete len:100 (-) Transcript_24800:546-845(-)